MSINKDRVQTILAILKKTYPHAKIALKYSNSWELLVAVILSAQCTDKKVNEVTEKLFKKYSNLDAYVNADITEFEQDIKPSGFYHNKAKNILVTAKVVKEKFGGNIPKTMGEMLTLSGVARKTANVVLGNAYGVVEGIAVDTHVLRISQRLRLVDLDTIGGKRKIIFNKEGNEIVDFIKDADPVKIEKELMRVVPKKQWFSLTYEVIDHGRSICKAQNPSCSICPLVQYCPVSRVLSNSRET